MAETADVVIVGVGVMGASIAFHLAERLAGRAAPAPRHTGTETSSVYVSMRDGVRLAAAAFLLVPGRG